VQSGWAELTGQNYEQYQGYGWAKVVHPEDVQPTLHAWNEAVKQKKIFIFEHRVKIKDGSYREFSIRAIPLLNSKGDIIEWVGVHTDITERKEYEKALIENEQKLNLVIEASELGNWEVNVTTNEFSYSDRYLEIFGHAKATVITRNDAAQQIHPDDRITRDTALETAYTTGVLYYKARLLWPDKSLHWIDVKGKIYFDKEDNPIKLIGTVRDVTEEKLYQQELEEREQKFRLLANSMPQFIWTGDTKGNLNYFNEAVFAYSGLSETDIKDQGWVQIVHPDDREENISQWIESVTKGKDFLFEHRFKRYDGQYRWQLSRAVPQRDAEGKITMWVGSSTDIQKIKEEEKRKDDFLQMVSHELKTPITSIKGYVQFLISLLNDEEKTLPILSPVKSSLVRVDIQIVRLTRLITEMLDLSRINSGKLDLQKSQFNLNELVVETIQDISHSNKTHTVNLHNDCQCDLTADRDRLGQVLINFINNAIKYSPKANTVDVRIFKTDKNEAAVSVKDWGIGISKDDQRKIFERFYRVEGKKEENFSGFGIGLFLANEIIQKHQGSILVDSDLGKGSTFTFLLPSTA
jgi:PAS domain S-box-containing protein